MRLGTKIAVSALAIAAVLTVPVFVTLARSDMVAVLFNRRPRQQQSVARIDSIGQLEVQRAGVLRATVVDLEGPVQTPPATLTFTLRSPASTVEDTDIRGYLDGLTKYNYNQGGAYHMRIGRRYGAPFEGVFELKRSLIRWHLPSMPTDARVRSARVRFWVESFAIDSPLSSKRFRPLHLLLYPIGSEWNEGTGGERHDDLSPAAPGEAAWNEARTGELSWPAPGALALDTTKVGPQYVAAPVATAVVAGDSRFLVFSGTRLADHLQASYDRSEPLNVLLKLEDEEENRWGTEFSILSSDHGDDKDVVRKRPTLEFDVEIPRAHTVRQFEFVAEPGMEHQFPMQRHPTQTVLLHAAIPAGHGVRPEVFIRGGQLATDSASAPWGRYTQPIIRRWDWSQFKISAAPNRVEWDEQFIVTVPATWVAPGPRQKQLPEMVLVAPSGERHRVVGDPFSERAYRLTFRPREIGLWRYGWSFRAFPAAPPGSQQGEGLFYVDVPSGEGEGTKLEELAETVLELARGGDLEDSALQANLNAFVRWAALYRTKGHAQRDLGDRLLARVREGLSAKR